MKLLLLLLCAVIILESVALFRIRHQRNEAWKLYRALRVEASGEIPKVSGVFVDCKLGPGSFTWKDLAAELEKP